METASRLFPQQFPAPARSAAAERARQAKAHRKPPTSSSPASRSPVSHSPFTEPPCPAAILGRPEELPVPACSAPSCRRQLGRGAAAAAETWRCSRPSPGPPSSGSPPPAAPRAPREVKSWENRFSLSSSPAAHAASPAPAVLRPAVERRWGRCCRRARAHRPVTSAARGLLVWCCFFYFPFSVFFFCLFFFSSFFRH